MLRSLTIIFLMTHCLKMEQILNKDIFFLFGEKNGKLKPRKRYPHMH